MKNSGAVFIAVVITVGVVCIRAYSGSVDDRWYGYCKIGQDERLIGFIYAGQELFVDHNADGEPQRDELISESDPIEVISSDGKSKYRLYDLSTFIVDSAVSNERPQVVDFRIQSNDFPAMWQSGTIVMAREPDNAGTCHLLGPLTISLVPADVRLTPGEINELKISLGTTQADAIAVSPDVGSSGALVYTSVPGDRTKYAYDESLRPRMEIAFDGQKGSSQTIVFDGFC